MSQQAHAREENAETFAGLQNLFRSVEEEFEKLQNKVSEQRKDFEKAAQTRVSKVQREIEKTPPAARAAWKSVSDQACSSTSRKLVVGICDSASSPSALAPTPIALADSINVSPNDCVSCSGRIVGCTRDRTPGRAA